MEVERLLVKAEQADSQGEMEPATLPQEIAKPQALKTKLEAILYLAIQTRQAPRSVSACCGRIGV
jgi:hypothetical protein